MNRSAWWWMLIPLGLGLAALALVVGSLHFTQHHATKHPTPARSPHGVTASPAPRPAVPGQPPVTVVVVPTGAPARHHSSPRPTHHRSESPSPSPKPTSSPTPSCALSHPLRCLPTPLPGELPL